MKRFLKAFTLSEILISMGIISVIAVLTAPSLLNLIPDKDKAQVIRLHKVVSNTTAEMLSNTTLYRNQGNKIGLANDDAPLDGTFFAYNLDDVEGDIKYPVIFASMLHTRESVSGDNLPIEFTTVDGVFWTIDKDDSNYEITVDIDSKVDDCVYSYDCQTPDRFAFKVSSDGRVTGGDPLTEQYLKTNTKMNNKKQDKENALVIARSNKIKKYIDELEEVLSDTEFKDYYTSDELKWIAEKNIESDDETWENVKKELETASFILPDDWNENP